MMDAATNSEPKTAKAEAAAKTTRRSTAPKARSGLREYESIYLLRPETADDAATKLQERFVQIVTSRSGQMLRVDNWGKRKLAYQVAKQGHGIYVLLHFVGGPGIVEELERNYRMIDEVMKYHTTKTGEDVDLAKRKAEVEELAQRLAAEHARQEAERKERTTLRPVRDAAQADDRETASGVGARGEGPSRPHHDDE